MPPWLWKAVLTLPALLLGVGLHEYAHAWVAHRLGDELPRRQGRLTANPLAHLDPLGTILFFLVGFGWGRPVETRPNAYRDPRRGRFLVAIAGVMANLLVAAVSALLIWAVMGEAVTGGIAAVRTGLLPTWRENLSFVLQAVLRLNLLLVAFNLLPCPPLDGGELLRFLLGRRGEAWMHRIEQHGSVLLLVLVLSGAIGVVLHPVILLFSLLMYAPFFPWAQLAFLAGTLVAWGAFLVALRRVAPSP